MTLPRSSPRILSCRVLFLSALLAASLSPAAAQSGPGASQEIVDLAAAATAPIPAGPFAPTWESLRANYRVPDWWRDAKFGIFMHWGLYAVPAHGSEWYALHMYNNPEIAQWHREHWGPPDKFGYKDFIPLFTAAKWDPDAWARLFKQAGARFVVPTAEHHDGFSLWDTAYNKYNAKAMGPHRDLIGDLAAAVRRQGLKFGVSNHSIEHYTFIREAAAPVSDLRDPRWADFYAVADRGNPAGLQKFLETWVAKNFELIDKYRPDLLWFDNGINARTLDPLKLHVAAYYYNRAKQWGKDVSLSTKSDAYLAGSITDFERMSRAPKELTPFPWQVDDPVLYRFGYTENNPTPIVPPGSVVLNLINNVSKNGGLLLNISPRADGTIPDDQQQLLRNIGAWLDVNGEAIYGTRAWIKSGEGMPPAREAGAPGAPAPVSAAQNIRFTTKGDTLYAIVLGWPGAKAVVTSLATGQIPAGKITGVTLLGHPGSLAFTQDAEGLKVIMPADKPCDYAYALKISGLTLRP